MGGGGRVAAMGIGRTAERCGGCWPEPDQGREEEERDASLRVWGLWAIPPCASSFPLPSRAQGHSGQAVVDLV